MITLTVKSLFVTKKGTYLPLGNNKANKYIKDNTIVKVIYEATGAHMLFKTKEDWVNAHEFTGKEVYKNIHPDKNERPHYKLAYFNWRPVPKSTIRLIWQCEECEDVVISYSHLRHDMNYCECGKSAVDLEEHYQRSEGKVKDISRKKNVDGKWVNVC